MVRSESLHEVFQTDDKLYIFVYNGEETLFRLCLPIQIIICIAIFYPRLMVRTDMGKIYGQN